MASLLRVCMRAEQVENVLGSGPEVLFKTCVAMTFVDDDNNDDDFSVKVCVGWIYPPASARGTATT